MSVNYEGMNVYPKGLQSAIFVIYIAESIDTISNRGLDWNNKPVKVFGIFISYDIFGNERKNSIMKVDDLKIKLAAWRSRKLSLFGHCLFVNTLGLSQIVCSASVDDTPNKYASLIQYLPF